MPRFEVVTVLPVPPERAFQASLDVEEHTRSLAGSGERITGGRTRGSLTLGEAVTFQARHFGLTWRLTARVTAWDPPRSFVDEQEAGPFARWRHEHRFAADGSGGTVMTDLVEYAAPGGPLGRLADATLLRWYLPRLLRRRNGYLAAGG